jgi:hypothetical protein
VGGRRRHRDLKLLEVAKLPCFSSCSEAAKLVSSSGLVGEIGVPAGTVLSGQGAPPLWAVPGPTGLSRRAKRHGSSFGFGPGHARPRRRSPAGERRVGAGSPQ